MTDKLIRTIKIEQQMLQALYAGKKLSYHDSESEITLLPPQYGLFITYEDWMNIKREMYVPSPQSNAQLLIDRIESSGIERCR